MEKKELGKFITKNKVKSDDFLVNQDKYIEISLKGQLCKKIGSKDALRLFALWNEENLNIKQRIEEIQEILYKDEDEYEYEYLDETLFFLDEEEDEEIRQEVIEQAIKEHEKGFLCPRCKGLSKLPTFTSRRDNKTEICSKCSVGEALFDLIINFWNDSEKEKELIKLERKWLKDEN